MYGEARLLIHHLLQILILGSLVLWNLDFTSVDALDDVVWVLEVDTAADGLGST